MGMGRDRWAQKLTGGVRSRVRSMGSLERREGPELPVLDTVSLRLPPSLGNRCRRCSGGLHRAFAPARSRGPEMPFPEVGGCSGMGWNAGDTGVERPAPSASRSRPPVRGGQFVFCSSPRRPPRQGADLA